MHTQYCIQNKRLDCYFSKHKLGVEIDEYGNVDRDFEYEQSRQLMIEKKLGCKIIRINPDAADFSIYRLINQISMHIKQSTKKSLIDNFSKRLLGLEFKANHSKIARNVLPTIQGINYLQTLFLFFLLFLINSIQSCILLVFIYIP